MDFRILFNSYLAEHKTKSSALFRAIRDGIVSGTIPHGTRLPSSREMAHLYELSRGTVSTVYEMLSAEGYLEAVVGRGTFTAYPAVPKAQPEAAIPELPLSGWGRRIVSLERLGASGNNDIPGVDFGLSGPDLRFFPADAWKRCLHAEIREASGQLLEQRFLSEGDAGRPVCWSRRH